MDLYSLQINMKSILEMREVQIIIQVTAVVALIFIAIYVVTKFREMLYAQDSSPVEHLSDFEQMNSDGHLNREEYERVRQSLGKQVRETMIDPQVLKDADGSG